MAINKGKYDYIGIFKSM